MIRWPHHGQAIYVQKWKGKAMLYLVSGNGIVRRGWTTNKVKKISEGRDV